MSDSKRIFPPLIEWTFVAAIITGLVVFIYPIVQSTRNPKGLHGKMIPTESPDESNRIVHATGLSIVAPLNWDQIRDMEPTTPFLCVASRGVPGRRLKSCITIRQCETPDDEVLNRFTQIKFQQHVAFEKMSVEREGTFDDPESSNYDLYVSISDQWWHINFLVADKMTVLPAEIRQYFDTIVFP